MSQDARDEMSKIKKAKLAGICSVDRRRVKLLRSCRSETFREESNQAEGEARRKSTTRKTADPYDFCALNSNN